MPPKCHSIEREEPTCAVRSEGPPQRTGAGRVCVCVCVCVCVQVCVYINMTCALVEGLGWVGPLTHLPRQPPRSPLVRDSKENYLSVG